MTIIPAVLGEVDPKLFRNRRVRIGYNSRADPMTDPESCVINSVDPEMSFMEMLAYRIPIDPSVIRHSVCTLNGHVFANIGLSAMMTTTIGANDYLVLAPALTGEMVKLISGYIPAADLLSPERTLETEIAEEFLPFTADGKVVRGRWVDSWSNPQQFPRPYGNILQDASDRFCLYEGSEFSMLRFFDREFLLEDRAVKHGPWIYFLAQTNSAQLVFPLHVNLPEEVIREGSLHLAEDHLVKERGVLEVRSRPYGMRLARLGDKGEFIGEVYSLREGRLVPEPVDGMVLSEVFGLKGQEGLGVTEVKNILFRDYMDLQRRLRA